MIRSRLELITYLFTNLFKFNFNPYKKIHKDGQIQEIHFTHNCIGQLKVRKFTKKSQIQIFTTESYLNLLFITLTLYKHRNQISDIIKLQNISTLSFRRFNTIQHDDSPSTLQSIDSYFQQIQESTNGERVQSYQTVSETVNAEKSELDVVLNVRKNIYLTNYERFITYQNIKYTIDEFFEILPNDIEFLRKDTHHLMEDIESTYKNINDDILNLRKDIEHLESFFLKQ
ncbi:234_t:CDS:1, partial [Racocetra fulgida]